MNRKLLIHFNLLATLILFWCGCLIPWTSPAYAAPLAHLESPSSSAYFRSGIGLIRGWSCEPGRVEISIDGGPLLATASGTDRPDTAEVCGRTNTGFGLVYNWSRLNDGVHNIRAFVGDTQFADVNFTVATLGGEFLTGLNGLYTVPDFPGAGQSAQLVWSQAHQNFVFTQQAAVPGVVNPPHLARAFLESPSQGSSESGVGLIRGWVCEANRIEISIDNGPRMAAAHGTDRPDTAATCGRTNTGFGLTYNWSRVSDGIHNVRAFADGVEFGNVNFAVTTLRVDFLRNIVSKVQLLHFPGSNANSTTTQAEATEAATTLQWSESDQNFVITDSTATGVKLAVVTAVTDILNKIAVAGIGANLSDTLGVHTPKNAQGQPTDVSGVIWADKNSQTWADLTLGTDGLPHTYKDSLGASARLESFTPNSVTVQFLDSNGQAQGAAVNAPINGGLLQKLQETVQKIRTRTAAVSVMAAPLVETLHASDATATSTLENVQFSLDALLVRLFGSSGIASSEALCAIRTAAATAGVSHLIATSACQSPMLVQFGALGARVASQTSLQADDQDPFDAALRKAFQLVLDIPIPCRVQGDSAGCLLPAADVLAEIAAPPARQLQPELPAPSTVIVPDMVGLNPNEAAITIKQIGLLLREVSYEHSATIPSGYIVRQSPQAGAQVAPGTKVDLVVSLGPDQRTIPVPNVVGQSQQEAARTLTGSGFKVGTVTTQHDPSVSAGYVISQNPSAGTQVAPGSSVNLVVSTGAATVPVPNVVGQYQQEAISILRSAGLTVGTVTNQYNPRIPTGQIISQNPSVGTQVVLGSAVDLVVSGPG